MKKLLCLLLSLIYISGCQPAPKIVQQENLLILPTWDNTQCTHIRTRIVLEFDIDSKNQIYYPISYERIMEELHFCEAFYSQLNFVFDVEMIDIRYADRNRPTSFEDMESLSYPEYLSIYWLFPKSSKIHPHSSTGARAAAYAWLPQHSWIGTEIVIFPPYCTKYSLSHEAGHHWGLLHQWEDDIDDTPIGYNPMDLNVMNYAITDSHAYVTQGQLDKMAFSLKCRRFREIIQK